jgi:hypothetical protein
MTVSIGDAVFSTLLAQPFSYEEAETRNGLTARKWVVTGLLTPVEWLDLLDVYNTWRDLRIDDPDTATSASIGVTVLLSGTGPGGQQWTDVDCWFIAAPKGEQSGNRISASVELVDATQALQVALKGQEIADLVEEIDFGTITLGDATLQLTKPADSYNQGPSTQLTVTGKHYINGPLVVEKILDVEGLTDLQGWNDVRSWYESTIVLQPSTDSYFPISPPTTTAENRIIDGIKTVQYTVSIQLIKIL